MRDITIEDWAAALESGDYQQGTHCLRLSSDDDDRGPYQFCCLGVLCDLRDPDSDAWAPNRGYIITRTAWDYAGNVDLPPFRIYDGLLLSANGAFRQLPDTEPAQEIDQMLADAIDRQQTSLVALNDAGWTFPDLARAIRRIADPDSPFTWA